MTRKAKPPIALYSALADTTRCRILDILSQGPIPVHQLADAFSISRPAISRHLRVLKTAGLVAEVKKGRENLYAFKPGKLSKGIDWLATFVPDAAPAEGTSASPEENAEIAVQAPEIILPDPLSAEAATAIEKPARKARQAPKPPQPETGINQMGFDF